MGISVLRSSIRSAIKSLPPLNRVFAERDEMRRELRRINPGHYYSPIPSSETVGQASLFDRTFKEIPGVELDIPGQLELLDTLSAFYPELPFPENPEPSCRYYYQNGSYSYSDAIFLYCMIRHARPNRIIEIGSGYSSFVMLDTSDKFFGGKIRFTFIEPEDERLRSRLLERDLSSVEILSRPVQSVDLSVFNELGHGDILFVDSSHVAKLGSDVNHILFEILPRVAPGVFVHFHNMFYPFEYPKEWIEEGRFWNEDYIVRAFLLFNSAFKIRIWNQFLGMFYTDVLGSKMPLCLKNIGGSMWLQRC